MAVRKNKPARSNNFPKELLTRNQVPRSGGVVPLDYPIEVRIGKRKEKISNKEFILAMQIRPKLHSLWRYYGFDPVDKSKSAFRTILVNVLRDFVPGFQPTTNSPGGGRPALWNAARLRDLCEDVDHLRERKVTRSVQKACDHLHKTTYKRFSAEALRGQYFKAKKRFGD